MAMSNAYHLSVLLQECLTALQIRPDGTYIDLTFGGGGHSRAILDQLSDSGRLIAFDQDSDAQRNVWDDSRLHFFQANFADAHDYLLASGTMSVDGVLADLGVSSFQLDNDESGFSFRGGIDLDMRMDKNAEYTAANILNSLSVDELQSIFQEYGEVRNARSLATRIVDYRQDRPILKSDDLNEILNQIKFGPFHSYAAPIYQALRMYINKEMKVLQDMLQSISQLIVPGGRMAIITFHSLEDRTVKQFMKYGEFTDEPIKDMFGKTKPWPWKQITKKPIVPSDAEIKQNSRSRSAKLRVIERIENKA